MRTNMKTAIALIVAVAFMTVGAITVAEHVEGTSDDNVYTTQIGNLEELKDAIEEYNISEYTDAKLEITKTITVPTYDTLDLSSEKGNITLLRSKNLSADTPMFTVCGTLNIDDNVIIDGHNIAVKKAAIIVQNGGNVIMNGGEICNNNVSGGYGGAIRIENGTFTMNGGNIHNNNAINGGGVTIAGNTTDVTATFEMNGGTIEKNTATNGAGVYLFKSAECNATFTMTGGSITGNTTTNLKSANNDQGNGGGVYVFGGEFIMENGSITSNNAANGAGVRITGNNSNNSRFIGSFILIDGTIDGNTATRNGGGVSIGNSIENNTTIFTMNGGSIVNNKSTGEFNATGMSDVSGVGGGIHIFARDGNYSTVTITGGEIAGNTSSYNGYEDIQISTTECKNKITLGDTSNKLVINGTVYLYKSNNTGTTVELNVGTNSTVDVVGFNQKDKYTILDASNGTYTENESDCTGSAQYVVTLGEGVTGTINGEAIISGITKVTINDTIKIEVLPGYENLTFSNVTKNDESYYANGNGKIEFNTTPINYTVTYIVDGNIVGVFQNKNIGDDVPTKEYYAPVGYKFNDFKLFEGELGTNGKIGSTNLVYTGTTTKIEYSVHFLNETETLKIGEKYSFNVAGYKEKSGTIDEELIKNAKENKITLNAEAIEYTVNLGKGVSTYINGTGNAIKDSVKITVEQYLAIELANGYTLETPIGMSVNAEKYTISAFGDKQEYFIPTTTNTYDVIYKITGDYFKNDEFAKATFEYGADTSSFVLGSTDKIGYTFNGWPNTLPKTMPANNVIIEGSYSINSYTVTLGAGVTGTINGEAIISGITKVTINDAMKIVASPGYKTLTATNATVKEEVYYANGDKNVEFNATAVNYTVTYNLDDGTNAAENIASFTVNDGKFVLKNATKDNCTFDGWFSDSEFKTAVTEIAGGMTEDITLYAKFTPIEHTVNFVDYNGTIISSAKYISGAEIVVPNNPVRSSTYDYRYSFAGWDPEVSLVCNGDATYTATYRSSAISHVTYSTVTVDQTDNGIVSGNIGTFADGTTITLTATANDGYRFLSWSNGETTETITFTLNSDVTISATFISNVVINDDVDSEGQDYTMWYVLLALLVIVGGAYAVYRKTREIEE